MCNGLFIDKSVDESWTFLHEVAEKTQQWESVREPRKSTNRGSVHKIESDFDGNAKIASLARRVEALELEKKLSSIEESVGLLTQNLLKNQKTTDQRFTSLELKIGQICDALNDREKGKFPSHPEQNPKGTFQAGTSSCNETAHAVTTLRSGKVVDNNVSMPEKSESESDSSLHTMPQKTSIVENESEHVCKSKNSTDVNVSLPTNVLVAPFPQRLVQQKKGTHYNEMFKRVNINIPFLEAIKQIPTYAKFLKDLCTQKRKRNVHKRAFLVEQILSLCRTQTVTFLSF
ncbi:uncharacterized protein LOC113350738 [Papaver somniferum]|uniref:uncharacterized protein LOC113350738 n=1 Tax=Papaver somniferum TaxID=3469 RepID=UPI000E703370|nr:uncharacterized protein LOC113350738 [Papaver somniferum]